MRKAAVWCTVFPRTAMATDREPSFGKIVMFLAAFLLPAIPLVAIAWSAVNDVAAGQLGRLFVAFPATAAVAVLLAVFGRLLRRLDAGR